MQEIPFDEWVEANPIKEELYFRSPGLAQNERFLELAERLGLPKPTVVSTHRSKSVVLPVACYQAPNGKFLLRDNFNDLNLCVLWDFPPNITFRDCYGTPMTWEWYLGEVARAATYWTDWNEEELNDPRILRVPKGWRNPSAENREDQMKTWGMAHSRDGKIIWPGQMNPDTGKSPYPDGAEVWWNSTTPEKKERWNARMTDPTWFWTQWSSGRLFIDGEMGPPKRKHGPESLKPQFYRAAKAHLQGISDVVPYEATHLWEPGKKEFTISTNGRETVMLIKKILESTKEE